MNFEFEEFEFEKLSYIINIKLVIMLNFFIVKWNEISCEFLINIMFKFYE